jgi:hypothetical protein
MASAALLALGCSSDDSVPRSEQSEGQQSASTRRADVATPSSRGPVAFRLSSHEFSRLASGDARRLIERAGEPIAESAWEAYPAIVLREWLHARGVDLEVRPGVARVLARIAAEQELTVLAVTAGARRSSARLAALAPSERELRRYYERFNEDHWPEAGRAMLAWLSIIRRAITQVDRGSVIVIPVDD